MKNKQTHESEEHIRLDKWLWAARLYKTRQIAKTAIEGGKVHYEGQRVKSSKIVHVGATLEVRLGWDTKVIVIQGLAKRRASAPEAQKLYTETEESQCINADKAAARKQLAMTQPHSTHKPNKKERREIKKLTR